MGLPASGKDVVNSGPDDLVAELRQKYNASNRGISVRFLEERLGQPEAGDDFKRAFLLYVLGTLLCPTARLDARLWRFAVSSGKQQCSGWLSSVLFQIFYYEKCCPLVEGDNVGRSRVGGYGCGEVISKERGLGLGLLNDRDHSDVLPLREVAARVNRGTLDRQDETLRNATICLTKDEKTPLCR
ncbi:hypothetical protein Tco_0332673 [Tanacetum coccineum]